MKAFETEIRELAKMIARGYGLTENDAELFITLYLEPEELSLEEISESTGYSLSTISTKMKVLEKMSVVKRIRRKKSRKAYYYMKKDLIELNIDKINAALAIYLVPVMDRLPVILRKYRKKVMAGKDERLKKRFKIMEDYLCMVRKMEKVLKKLMRELHSMKDEVNYQA